ncbi:MAG: hypothetical protein QF886_13390 [Planctomycetota bacterium]|nr:hypothetical protein [Planctomycetota bacterium]
MLDTSQELVVYKSFSPGPNETFDYHRQAHDRGDKQAAVVNGDNDASGLPGTRRVQRFGMDEKLKNDFAWICHWMLCLCDECVPRNSGLMNADTSSE